MSGLQLGTTSPQFVPRNQEIPTSVKSGKNYFSVKILSAQAAVYGPIWEHANQLIVCSSISLNHPLLGSDPINAIQLSTPVKQGQTIKLGIAPILIDMVPATMTHITISIDFVLDTKNLLLSLAGLINSNAFLFVGGLSLTPAAVAAAKAISTISNKLMDTFLPNANQRKPILHFSGDFETCADGLQDGYYVILGTINSQNPLPNATSKITVVENDLQIDGKTASNLSYVIFNIRCYPARGRELDEGTRWNQKLNQVDMMIQETENDPFSDREKKIEIVKKCQILIKEAQALLSDDPRYTQEESSNIIKASFQAVNKLLEKNESLRSAKFPIPKLDRNLFGISPEEDLEKTLVLYAKQKEETKRIVAEEAKIN